MNIIEKKTSSTQKLNASIPDNIRVSLKKNTVILTRFSSQALAELKFDQSRVVITDSAPLVAKIYKS